MLVGELRVTLLSYSDVSPILRLLSIPSNISMKLFTFCDTNFWCDNIVSVTICPMTGQRPPLTGPTHACPRQFGDVGHFVAFLRSRPLACFLFSWFSFGYRNLARGSLSPSRTLYFGYMPPILLFQHNCM